MSGLAIRGNQRGRESFQIARREAMLTDPVSQHATGRRNDEFSVSYRMARYRFAGGMALSPAANFVNLGVDRLVSHLGTSAIDAEELVTFPVLRWSDWPRNKPAATVRTDAV